MPQMMPMNWIFMFAMLNMIMIMMTILMFNQITNKLPTNSLTMNKYTYSWMW